MDDYYEIVGVDRTASREAIDRKIRDQLRLWQRRTSSADLERRQEAERRVQQLGEARGTLLDEEKRRAYDRQLTAYRSSDPPPAPDPATRTGTTTTGTTGTTGGAGGAGGAQPATRNWLDQARGYLAENDHHSAAYAAREMLRSTPNPPTEAWTLLARANAGLGRLDDALFEARRATSMEPRSVEAHLALARVHEQRREWLEASRAYETATTLDTRAEAPHLGMARSLARAGRSASAVERLERRYSRSADRTREGRLLAQALLEVVEESIQPRGGLGATASGDLALAQRLLGRARQVTNDQQVHQRADRLQQEAWRRYPRGAAATGAFDAPRTGTIHPIGRQRTNSLAVAALICALLGLVPPGVMAPVGAIIGHVARRQIRERGEQGDGLALSGIVIGWVLTTLVCCGFFLIVVNS